MTLLHTTVRTRLSHPVSAFLNSITWLIVASVGCCLLLGLLPKQARAETRTITGQGEYRLGDRDTKEDGIRQATEQAKRNALDQVASYLESVTVVRDLDITQDEIRSYTAGVVLILNHRVILRLDDQTVVVRVTLTAQVNTDEVVQALAAVKQHEEARGELSALKEEIDQLHHELDRANQALAAATTPEQAREFSQQRDELLSRAQSNAMVAQAWTNWVLLVSPVPYPSAWGGGLPHVQALISVAGQLNPNNPHVHAVQQAVATQPPVPRMPPAPPVPHTVPFLPRMPTYQVVPRPPAMPEPEESPSSTAPSSVVQQVIPPPSQPPTLHTWPPTKQQTNPHQSPRQGTAVRQYGTVSPQPKSQSFQPPPQQSGSTSPGGMSGSR